MDTCKEIEDLKWGQRKKNLYNKTYGLFICVLREDSKCINYKCIHVHCIYRKKKIWKEIIEGNKIFEGYYGN